MLDSMRDTVEDILKHPERYPTPFVAATLPKKDKTLRDLSMKYMGLEVKKGSERSVGLLLNASCGEQTGEDLKSDGLFEMAFLSFCNLVFSFPPLGFSFDSRFSFL